MTIYAVPCVPGVQSNWVQRTQLDGRDFMFRFVWNQRDGHWSIDLADQDSIAIASGIKLVINRDLLATVVDDRRPPGTLVVIDLLGTNDVDPGFADLGDRFALEYVSSP